MLAARLHSMTMIRWLGLLALLVHAGLVARHNAHLLGVSFASQELGDGVICGSDAAAAADLGHERERLPASAGAPCPVCSNTVGGHLLPPDRVALKSAHFDDALPPRAADHALSAPVRDGPPPNRGPPRAA